MGHLTGGVVSKSVEEISIPGVRCITETWTQIHIFSYTGCFYGRIAFPGVASGGWGATGLSATDADEPSAYPP